MKKIFSFAAAMIAAMSMSAQDPISVTCAEAAAAMPAQSGSETEEVYIVTGYITNTNGNISKGQQTFYMDDAKGSKKTLQGYWCNLPAEEVEANKPLNVGDKITLTGKIMNYNNTPEIKNGDVVILERISVEIDTIDVDVCEALEEGSALNPGDYTDDVFRVYGRLKGTETLSNTGLHTFEMACGEDIFKPYNCKGEDGLELGKGDSVVVIGKLYNYNGVIEISNGTVVLLERSKEEEIITAVTVSEAVEIAMALENGKTTEDRYAVTGYVDSIATAFSEQYQNISFFMTDDMEAPAYNFEAFRVKCTAEEAEKIVVGAKVTVTAALQHYYKAATEEADAIDLAETVAGGILSFPEEQGIESIVLTEKAQKVVVDGVVYIIRDNKMFNTLGTQVK